MRASAASAKPTRRTRPTMVVQAGDGPAVRAGVVDVECVRPHSPHSPHRAQGTGHRAQGTGHRAQGRLPVSASSRRGPRVHVGVVDGGRVRRRASPGRVAASGDRHVRGSRTARAGRGRSRWPRPVDSVHANTMASDVGRVRGTRTARACRRPARWPGPVDTDRTNSMAYLTLAASVAHGSGRRRAPTGRINSSPGRSPGIQDPSGLSPERAAQRSPRPATRRRVRAVGDAPAPAARRPTPGRSRPRRGSPPGRRRGRRRCRSSCRRRPRRCG